MVLNIPYKAGDFLGQTVAFSQDPVEVTPGAANAQEGGPPLVVRFSPVGWEFLQNVVIGVLGSVSKIAQKIQRIGDHKKNAYQVIPQLEAT